MIASSVPLANYEPLADGELLRDAMAVAGSAP
jgi:hypothetical protein